VGFFAQVDKGDDKGGEDLERGPVASFKNLSKKYQNCLLKSNCSLPI